jgi:hypothetical protein
MLKTRDQNKKREKKFWLKGRSRGLKEPTFVQQNSYFFNKNKPIVKKDNDAIIETNCHF